MNAHEAGAARRRAASAGATRSVGVREATMVLFGASLTSPPVVQIWRMRLAFGSSVSMLSRHSPDPPDRRTSEEAHLRGRGSVRADCNRRPGDDGERRN